MICDKYKMVNRDNLDYYYPILDENKNYGKEMGNLGLMVPKNLKKRFVSPIISVDGGIYTELSEIDMLICTVYFQRFIYQIIEAYPMVICVKLKESKYVKFVFNYFCAGDFVKMPFVTYTPTEIVGKKEASKYIVCIEEE